MKEERNNICIMSCIIKHFVAADVDCHFAECFITAAPLTYILTYTYILDIRIHRCLAQKVPLSIVLYTIYCIHAHSSRSTIMQAGMMI